MSGPHKCESPAATGLIAEQITHDTMIVDRADAARKRFCNLRTLLALRGGHLVHELAGGAVVTKGRGRDHEEGGREKGGKTCP